MHPAVLDGRLERPLHARHAHGVHVGIQKEGLAASAPAGDADRVEAPGGDLFDLHLESRSLEPGSDEACDLTLPGRAGDQVGVDRIDADEVSEELRQRAHSGCSAHFSALVASSGVSSPSGSSGLNSTSSRSMRCPSTSTTSKRSPSCSTSSPGCGARPSSPKTKPATVW